MLSILDRWFDSARTYARTFGRANGSHSVDGVRAAEPFRFASSAYPALVTSGAQMLVWGLREVPAAVRAEGRQRCRQR